MSTYNKKITIQKRTSSKDRIGNDISTWADYVSAWADVNGLYGKEYWAAKEHQAENTVNFKIRYAKILENMTPQNYRIVYRNRIYDIQHVDNVKYQNRELIIKAVYHVKAN